MSITKLEKSADLNYFQLFVITLLRLVLGYHFLYEGLQKFSLGNWTSGGYLLGSEWIFSDLFHSIALNQTILSIVDFLNIWGQIIIGILLILGLGSKYAAWAGSFLLALYYIANPPFIYNEIFINVILLEFLTFLTIAVFNTSEVIGLDRLITKLRKK